MPETDTIHILHLEDNPLDAELTSELLATAGMHCDLTRIVQLEELRQAVSDGSKHKFNLILADYNMPGFDGMTALNLVRSVDVDVPFILLSGALGEEVAVELLRNGATDYVLKNNMKRLPLVVTRAIEEYQGRIREKISQQEIREARDEAQKASSAKGRFLGRISHELRTPLNAIIGYTQLMQADPMSEEQQHCTEQILKAGEHLLHLINEVLDITRIESGVIPLNSKVTSITPVIERAVDLVRPIAREAQVTINVDGGPCQIYAHVDKDRLAQVLINLLTNGVKYNRPGGHVYVECQEERPGYLKLIVRDTGIGIHPDKMERLFTPFDRLDLEKDSSIPGTGLGLTVSKALIEAMDGKMGVISAENEGTIFWLEVPLAQAPEAVLEESDSSPAIEAIPTLPSDCKILLVENHAASADFLTRVFYRRGNQNVCVATCVADALEKLKQTVPDIIITDIVFPDQSGEDLIKTVRSDSRTSTVPVIVTAIETNEQRKQKLEQMGVFSYLHKPLRINRLLKTVLNAYQDSRQSASGI